MPLTPKLKKKSKVRTCFYRIAIETLEGETVPFREIRATVQQQVRTSECEIATVEQFVKYPNLPNDDSDNEPEMEEEAQGGGTPSNLLVVLM